MQIMLKKLQICQKTLGPKYTNKEHFMATTLRAIENVKKLRTVITNPAIIFPVLLNQIIVTFKLEKRYAAHNTFFVNRKYK